MHTHRKFKRWHCSRLTDEKVVKALGGERFMMIHDCVSIEMQDGKEGIWLEGGTCCVRPSVFLVSENVSKL